MKNETFHILGGGPVGSLLALMLVKKGYEVSVFEKRNDPRGKKSDEGRSINLALSHRGIRALDYAGIAGSISQHIIPMEGRMMHDVSGNLTFQAYGKSGQSINSISRLKLTQILCDQAEKAGVNYFFGHQCTGVDVESNRIEVNHQGHVLHTGADYLIGADGAFSVLRETYEKSYGYGVSMSQLSYGYKELSLAPLKGSQYVFQSNCLHIWPRGNYMLIALPNPGGNFTCTLFMSLTGPVSFEQLDHQDKILEFFNTQFPDIVEHMPDLVEQYKSHPTSYLNLVDCFPWAKNRSMIIGDAAHAIVPFYGQGMNAGFEDCRLLMRMAEDLDFDWDKTFSLFQQTRKNDADAISELALNNFVEMRDKVADENFLQRKKLDALLHAAYPETWLPMYSMVTFSDLPYSACVRIGQCQKKAMDIVKDWSDLEQIELQPILSRFNDLMKVAQPANL